MSVIITDASPIDVLGNRLIEYVEQGHTKKVKELMSMGVDPNTLKKEGVPVIVLAADLNYTGVVRALITDHTEVDQYDQYFETALYKAAYNGNKLIVKMLADAGAYLDLQGRLNRTPLVWAVYRKHYDLVKLLIRYGADPTIPDTWQNTALDYAKERGCTEIEHLLV